MNASAKATPAAMPVGGYDLNKSNILLLKFFFTNQDHVPANIPHVSRTTSYGLDFKHHSQAQNAGRAELGELGRHRENRVDTGEPVINNLPSVRIGGFIDQLLASGFALHRMHWMEQKKEGRKTKYVVVCEFKMGSQTDPLPAQVMQDLQYLAFTAVWFCHLWDNSALGKPATINLVGRDPNTMAKYVLTIEDNKISANPLNG